VRIRAGGRGEPTRLGQGHLPGCAAPRDQRQCIRGGVDAKIRVLEALLASTYSRASSESEERTAMRIRHRGTLTLAARPLWCSWTGASGASGGTAAARCFEVAQWPVVGAPIAADKG
jgi:hypothetical protein